MNADKKTEIIFFCFISVHPRKSAAKVFLLRC